MNDIITYNKTRQRRKFLLTGGKLGIMALGMGIVIPKKSMAGLIPLYESSRSGIILGKQITLTAFSGSRLQSKKALSTAFTEMESLAEQIKKWNIGPEQLMADPGLSVPGLPKKIKNLRNIAGKPPFMGKGHFGLVLGYMLDTGACCLARNGAIRVLAGSDGCVRAIGGKGPGKAFIKNIEFVNGTQKIPLEDGAVSCSHALDKEKNNGIKSAVVTALDATEATALSGALLHMDPETGLKLMEKRPYTQCLIIKNNGQPCVTQGWPILS